MPLAHRPLARTALLVLAASFGLAGAVTLGHLLAPGRPHFAPSAAVAQGARTDALFDVSDVAERVLPAVVSVSTRTLVSARELPPGMHQFFDPFFDFGDRPPRESRGLGSGVVVDGRSGIILTNNHVVAGASEIVVTLQDGTDLAAEIVGTDPQSDVAVLRLRPEGKLPRLSELALGNSDSLRLGEVVLAVGSPFGYSGTVTMGIVSAKGRADTGIVRNGDFIQTDAAINPGNSGGALVNMRGELVGINTAIASRGGGSIGIGFAIPSNLARPIMEALLRDGRVARGYLGIQMQELSDPALAEQLGARGAQGVLIADVVDGSPAAGAGLVPGDVVQGFDGVKIDSVGRLGTEVARRPAGQRIKVDLLRQGKPQSLVVTLGEQPTERLVSMEREEQAPRVQSDAAPRDGLRVQALDASIAQRIGVSPDAQGVVVAAVEPGSLAQRAGLRPGDLVLEVNRAGVRSVGDFEKAWSVKGTLTLRVQRGDSMLFLALSR